MSLKDEILELISIGDITTQEIMDIGYSRNNVHAAIFRLMEEGEIFKHGKGKLTRYSTNPVPKSFPKKKEQKIVLPDLPPIMLKWGGYTDKVPDQTIGRIIEGEL